MDIETLVLNRHESMLQILRHHVDGDRDTVGVGGYELGRLIILDIVDKGRKTGRRDIDIADVRSAGEHTLEYADPCAGADDAGRDYGHQTDLYKG